MPRKRGQGAFEYILLVAGILLIVVVVVLLLKSGVVQGAQKNVGESSGRLSVNSKISCLDFCGEGAWSYVANAEPSARVTPYVDACTLAEGVNGNASCFYGESDAAARDGAYHYWCNASNVTGMQKYANTRPNNQLFCGYVRENAP
ncbi:MAG: class III signal peptide-containing protein [Candidatus Micrarchaeia archaeon]